MIDSRFYLTLSLHRRKHGRYLNFKSIDEKNNFKRYHKRLNKMFIGFAIWR